MSWQLQDDSDWQIGSFTDKQFRDFDDFIKTDEARDIANIPDRFTLNDYGALGTDYPVSDFIFYNEVYDTIQTIIVQWAHSPTQGWVVQGTIEDEEEVQECDFAPLTKEEFIEGLRS